MSLLANTGVDSLLLSGITGERGGSERSESGSGRREKKSVTQNSKMKVILFL